MNGDKVSIDIRDEARDYRVFLISVSLGIGLCISGIFLGMAVRSRQLLNEEILNRARTDFNNIVLTRKWNAGYGGVFVEKKPGIESNPYLPNPDIRSVDGKVYTKKNPALMTREISALSEKDGLFSFHITSLRPINPINKPDAFEEAALKAFETGQKESYGTVQQKGEDFFRYIAPLYVEESCLLCHASQGYRTGDIRGGISVSIKTEDLKQRLAINFLAILVFALITLLLLLGTIFFFFNRLRQRLAEARRQLEMLALLDGLTGLYNRRILNRRFSEELERHKRIPKPLSCVICDIDHFKNINDKLGHLVGDDILKKTANVIRTSVRTYDIVGRYGGEEFMAIMPDTGIETAVSIAERLRRNVAKEVCLPSGDDGHQMVTISIGLSCLQESDSTIEQLIDRADSALYRAKSAGRNRVEVIF